MRDHQILRDAKAMCMDREQWRDFVKRTNGDANVKGIPENSFNAK